MSAKTWIDNAVGIWPKLLDDYMDGDSFTPAGRKVYEEAVRRLNKLGITTEQADAVLVDLKLRPRRYGMKFEEVVSALVHAAHEDSDGVQTTNAKTYEFNGEQLSWYEYTRRVDAERAAAKAKVEAASPEDVQRARDAVLERCGGNIFAAGTLARGGLIVEVARELGT